MEGRYRKILPASWQTSGLHPGGQSSSGSGAPDRDRHRSKKRRTNVRIACNACRSRKAACDGNRPRCARCNKGGIICEYVADEDKSPLATLKDHLESVRRDLQQHADVLQHLRTAPEPEAIATIRRLRSTPNVSDVLTAIRTRISPHRPSERRAARAILPPTDTDVEFELSILHGMSYPTLLPLDTSVIDLDDLFNHSSSMATTVVGPDDAEDTRQEIGVGTETLVADLPSPLRGAPTRRVSPVAGPSPPPYCDARLNHLNLRFWTKVPISDEFAARAISAYLESEHAITGWFDADLFLTDLVEHRLEYCSAFLVSAYLSKACVSNPCPLILVYLSLTVLLMCYAGFDPRASSFGRALYREARVLWQAEQSSPSLTTVAALTILSLAAAALGEDQFSQEVLEAASRMGQSMHLFGVPHTTPSVAAYRQMSPERVRAAAHVAWGTYGFLTFHAIFFKGDPIPFPPGLPIPGRVDGATTGSSTVRWPDHPLPSYMGQTFTSFCEYWVIVQEIIAVYWHKDERSVQDRVPLAFAESKYQRLLLWADGLVSDMARGRHLPGHALIFWTLYHIAVLDLFRPFIQQDEEQRLLSFKSLDSSPDAIFNASLRQLQRLLFEYRTRIQPKHYSIWLNCTTMHVSSTALRNLNQPDWRFFFLLCMGFWKEGVTCYPVLAVIAQANLSLAMDVGCVTGNEAQTLMEEMRVRLHRHELAEIATSSIFDFARAMSAGEDGIRVDELARRFEDLVTFDMYTN